jgi:NagD protein
MDGITHYLTDMDGVIVRGPTLIPGAAEFVQRLRDQAIPFLILTNNSQYTPRDLQVRLSYLGLEVPPDAIFTSALATAQFLHSQRPDGRAYVIGESGLTTALHDIGYVLTDQDPEYVVLGETTTYSFERITRAIRFITNGARFIATNPDVMGPGEGGIVPATGAVAALISSATGVKPYFIGKPNPLMMRTALRTLNAHSENSVMIGDRMDTDIIAGIESGLRTILVLTGVTSREQIERFPYRPTWIRDSIAAVEV